MTKAEVTEKLLTEYQAQRFPLVAARRYFRTVRTTTDLHTAYTQALGYYTALTVKTSQASR